MTAAFQPYPWHDVPRWTRAQAQLWSHFHRGLLGPGANSARETLASLVGAPVAFGRVQPVDEGLADRHSPTLKIVGDAEVLCEISGTLAAWIVDRALGGDARLGHVDAGLSLRDETSLGVLAYVAARVLRAIGGSCRLAAVTPSPPQQLPRRDLPTVCVVLCLTIADVEVAMHLRITKLPATRARQANDTNTPFARMLLEQPAVLSAQLACSLRVQANTVSSLSIDDVITIAPDAFTMTGSHFNGPLHLRVLGTTSTRWVAHGDAERIELQHIETTKELHVTTTDPLSDVTSTTEQLAKIADTPLELSIEVARYTLPLGEIAALAQGDVLLTGQPIGQHVTVRAGVRAIATGELVNVDGVVGVRILSLANP